MAVVQAVGAGAGRTWTVVGGDYLPVSSIEEFLEFMRVARSASPNTVRSYASALAGLWGYLERTGGAWDQLSLAQLTGTCRRCERETSPGSASCILSRPGGVQRSRWPLAGRR